MRASAAKIIDLDISCSVFPQPLSSITQHFINAYVINAHAQRKKHREESPW
jgi:hypothetical protein